MMSYTSYTDKLFRQIDKVSLYNGERERHINKIKKLLKDFKSEYPNKNFNKILKKDIEFGKNFTPLHMAVLRSSLTLLELFIEEGADPFITVNFTYFSMKPLTPLELCYKCKIFSDHQMCKILKSYNQTFIINYTTYNSIIHCKTIQNYNLNCINTNTIYKKIHNKILKLFIIKNRINNNLSLHLPNELWFKILESNYLKDY